MKESTIIAKFKEAEQQRLQNNRMVQSLVQDMQDFQKTFAGFISVIRRLPGYDDVIKQMTDERAAEAEKKDDTGLNLDE
jgi:DNA-binding ferritin-like protein